MTVTQNVCSARETQSSVFGSKMIVNNVAVSPVCAFWHITMCAGHVSQLLIIKQWFINLLGKKGRYTSATLALGSWCVKWHHLTAYFSARFLILVVYMLVREVETRARDYKRFKSTSPCSTHNLCSEMT